MRGDDHDAARDDLLAISAGNVRHAFALAQSTLQHDVGNCVATALLALKALHAHRGRSVSDPTVRALLEQSVEALQQAAGILDEVRRAACAVTTTIGVADVRDCALRASAALNVPVRVDVSPGVLVALDARDLLQLLADVVTAVTAGERRAIELVAELDDDAALVTLHVRGERANQAAPPQARARACELAFPIARRIVEAVAGKARLTVDAHAAEVVVELPLARVTSR